MLDVLVLSVITILLIVPLAKKNISYEKKWKEEALWPAVSVNEYTGRVHAGCASFEYLPSKAFEHLDYIKQRENKTYILNGSAQIENEELNSLLTTIRNQASEIEMLEKELKSARTDKQGAHTAKSTKTTKTPAKSAKTTKKTETTKE